MISFLMVSAFSFMCNLILMGKNPSEVQGDFQQTIQIALTQGTNAEVPEHKSQEKNHCFLVQS